MLITRATVLLTSGPDKIILETGMPSPFETSLESLSFTFEATCNKGAEYVRRWFKVEPQVINTRPNQHTWRMYDTGIGYGGYKECIVCGLNTYSSTCSKCYKITELTDVCAGKRHCECKHEREIISEINNAKKD